MQETAQNELNKPETTDAVSALRQALGANADITDLFFMPGDIKATARGSAPSGWLLCDGSAVSRATYPKLFDAIGTTYGAGNGTTTFNLPDLRGRVPVGEDGSAGRLASNDSRGQSGGAATHTLTTDEMPTHAHGVTDPGHAHSISDPGHAHGFEGQALGYTGVAPGDLYASYADAPVHYLELNSSTQGAGTGIGINGAATGVTVQNNGSGGAHNNLQPYQVVNFLVKT